MKIDDTSAQILDWAANLGTAFTTAEAFNQLSFVENAKEMSDTIRKLWVLGHFARKKIDNVRYSYIVSELATDDYERYTNPPKPDEVKQAVDSFLAKQAPDNVSTPTPTKPTQAAAKKEAKSEEANIQPQNKPESFNLLPERFSLTLQTPGSITITITAGA